MKLIVPIVLTVLVASTAHSQKAPPAAEKSAPSPAKTTIAPIQKGWFGIGLQAATSEEQKAIGVMRPVPRVIRVFSGSPAENSGVKVGEYVTRFNQKDVLSTQDLVTRVGAQKPGTEVAIELRTPNKQRGAKGAVRTVNVVLDLRPDMRALQRSQWLGKPFPKVTVEQVSPKPGKLTLGTNKKPNVLVVDYFATWCGPCRRVFPVLSSLQKKYAQNGLKVIAVSAEKPEVLRKFLEQTPLEYAVSSDQAGEFRQALWVNVLPTLWVVSKDGTIRNVLFGAGHGPKLEAQVREALGLGQEPVSETNSVKDAAAEAAPKTPRVKKPKVTPKNEPEKK